MPFLLPLMSTRKLWPQMVIALGIIVFICFDVASVAAYHHDHPNDSRSLPPYYYTLTSPTSPSPSPPHSHHHIMVIGKVYCYAHKCYDGREHPQDLHYMEHLKDALVEVICKAGTKIIKAYGKTNSNGEYNITLQNFDYVKYGFTICNAKLYVPPKDSSCNIPTELNEGSNLKVKSKGKYEVVLKAEPFAFATDGNCGKNKPSLNYKSPPPLSQSPYPPSSYYFKTSLSPTPGPPPPYYYQFPPPPKELPILVRKKKSPPPPPPVTPPFDFFMLALTWPASFCKANQCGNNILSKYKTFTIHGLWPQNKSDPQPRDCTPFHPIDWMTTVGSLKNKLEDNWPDLTQTLAACYVFFWQNQWKAHGNCSSMSPYDYFDRALKIHTNTKVKLKNILPGSNPVDYLKIFNDITKAIGSTPQIMCKKIQNDWYLLEIRLCLDRSKVLDKSIDPLPYKNCNGLRNCPDKVYFSW